MDRMLPVASRNQAIGGPYSAHHALLVLAGPLVELERDAALHQGVGRDVDVRDREVEDRVSSPASWPGLG